MNIKNWIFAILLVFVPISIAWNFLRWDVTIVFLSACLAIVPLAAYMGKATEEICPVKKCKGKHHLLLHLKPIERLRMLWNSSNVTLRRTEELLSGN